MINKRVVKKNIKKIPVRIVKKTGNTENILIENFVALQRVMTNLSLKFDNLTSQISKLLELFEISAKSLAEKHSGLERGEKNEDMVEKLDNLLEQNKVIARGLTLLHGSNSPQIPQHPRPQQLPPTNPMSSQPFQGQRIPVRNNEYQKSISSNPKNKEN